LSQIIHTLPSLLITLQFLQIFFTDALTFIKFYLITNSIEQNYTLLLKINQYV